MSVDEGVIAKGVGVEGTKGLYLQTLACLSV